MSSDDVNTLANGKDTPPSAINDDQHCPTPSPSHDIINTMSSIVVQKSIELQIQDSIPSNHASLRSRMIVQSSDILGYDNFPMGCLFSPDGTCILTATAADGKFRLYNTPFQLLGNSNVYDDADGNSGDCDENEASNSCDIPKEKMKGFFDGECSFSHNQNYQKPSLSSWTSSLTSHQGGPPAPSASASYSWYPLMNSSSPLTSLYITCRGHSLPIHLIDAYTSELRASYRPYNKVDEMEGPTVVEFSPDGKRIYGTGFKSDRTIAVFDTALPGREGSILRLGNTRRSADGQKGIPSAIAFPKSNNGTNGPSNVFAVGTYSPASIYIYDDRMSSCSGPAGTIVMHSGLTVVGHGRAFARKKRRFPHVAVGGIGNDDGGDLLSSARVNWFQSRARGGITQLKWAPPASSNPFVLFSASRRSNAVLSWDLRALSGKNKGSNESGNRSGSKRTNPVCGLRSYSRDGDTNQRLDFDIDDNGDRIYMGTGVSEGVVKVYDVNQASLLRELDIETGLGGQDTNPVNGISFMGLGSFGGLVAVAIGSRRYCDVCDEGDEEIKNTSSHGFLQLYRLTDLSSTK